MEELGYVLNNFISLSQAILVMVMALGFCMLEVGFVRPNFIASICLKNIASLAICLIAYYFIGFNLMFNGTLEVMNLDLHKFPKSNGLISNNSLFFINSLYLATAASIISGAMAERVSIYGYLAFVVVVGVVLYPYIGSWVVKDGWLYVMGFKDFAGATHIHSVGGWFALTGVFVLGSRLERYDSKGDLVPFKTKSIPFGTLGTLLIWVGFLGFNTGSLTTFETEHAMHFFSAIMINTVLSGAIGIITILVLIGRGTNNVNLKPILNGALASLVSITAFPYTLNTGAIVIVAIVAAVLSYVASDILERLHLDDTVGAIPVHLVGGVWGTIAVGIFGQADLQIQILGVSVVGLFCLVTSLVVWKIIEKTIGIRISEEEELSG